MTPLVAFIIGLLVGWIVEWVIDWIYWRRRFTALQTELDQAKARLSASGPTSSALEGQIASLKDELATQQRKTVSLNSEITAVQQKSASLEADKAALNQQLTALGQEKSSLTAQLEACQATLSAERSRPTVEEPGMRPAAPTLPEAALGTQAVGMAAPEPAAPEPAAPDDLVVIKGIGLVINHKLNQAGIYTYEQLAAITPERLREIVGDVIQRLADEESIITQARDLAAKKKAEG
jgi:predicted flap endonuclease-1-like 5' DNA nuclease